MKNILLIGGSGFVGRHLLNELHKEQKYKVFIVGKVEHIDGAEKTFIGDIGDDLFLADVIDQSRPEIIYYMVTNFFVNSIDIYAKELKNSAINLNNLFKCLNNNSRLVYLGSSAQYGKVHPENQPVVETISFNPVSNYGVLKSFEEMQIRQLSDKFNIDTIVARIFNITGPNEPTRMIGGAIVSQLIKSNQLKIGNLYPKRDFLDVRDVSHALKIIGLKGVSGEVYNICFGKSVSIKDYLAEIVNEIGCKPDIETSFERVNKSEINDLVGNNEKIKKLGWKPEYSLKQTIKDLVKSYREQLK